VPKDPLRTYIMEIPPKEGSSSPRCFGDLPAEVQALCNSLLDRLKTTLDDTLYGIYLYGAVVFPETRYIHDIDLHVIVKRPLTVYQNEEIRHLHKALASEFPQVVGDGLDAWYILLDDAQKVSSPRHQVYPDKVDGSWALHRAHMRAGYCIVLYGPKPEEIFPAPAWSELVQGLEVEQGYIEELLGKHPDYCVLNLCRLLYSYRMKDVVVSKRASAVWALNHLANWGHLIDAALRVYEREGNEEDRRLLTTEMGNFYQFVCDRIDESNR